MNQSHVKLILKLKVYNNNVFYVTQQNHYVLK